MERQLLIRKYPAINKDVKICVECGSFSIQQENQFIHCKDCERSFEIKGDQR